MMNFMLIWLFVMDNNYVYITSSHVHVSRLEVRMNRKITTDLHREVKQQSCLVTLHNKGCIVFDSGKESGTRKNVYTCNVMYTTREIDCRLCSVETKLRIQRFQHKTTESLKQPKTHAENNVISAFWTDLKKHFIGRYFDNIVSNLFSDGSRLISNEDGLLHKAKNYLKIPHYISEHRNHHIVLDIIHFILLLVLFIYVTITRKRKSELKHDVLENETKVNLQEERRPQSVNKCQVTELTEISKSIEEEEKTDNEDIGNIENKVSEDFSYVRKNSNVKSSLEVVIYNVFQYIHPELENVFYFKFAFVGRKKGPIVKVTNKVENLHLHVNKGVGVFAPIAEEGNNTDLPDRQRYFRKRKIIREQSENPKVKQTTEIRLEAQRNKTKTHLSGKSKTSFYRRKSKRPVKKKKKKKKSIKNIKRKCMKSGNASKRNTMASKNEINTKQHDAKHEKEQQEENYQRILSLVKNKSNRTTNTTDQLCCEIVQEKPKTNSEQKVPDLLEIRGPATATGHDTLIREISERFNVSEKTKESVEESDKKIIMVEKEPKKDIDTNIKRQKGFIHEKESVSLLIQSSSRSIPFEITPLFVYPISPYFERFATFSTWPLDAPVSAIRVCEAGFQYKGIGQLVECLTCKIKVSSWKKGDVPIEIHQKLSPRCQFLISKEHVVTQSNVPSVQIKPFTDIPETGTIDTVEDGIPAGATGYTPDLVNQFRTAMHISETAQPAVLEMAQETSVQTENERFELDSTTFKHPDYAAVKSRLESFMSWQFHHKQDPRKLVDAGLFSIGRDDIVRCFCCDIGLADWEPEDDPWTEHAKHSPNCAYVIKERGQEFIDMIQESWRQFYSPKHPHLADYHTRLQTFTTWPSDIQQRPPELCQAGFFYTEEDDVVRCHYCDGGLRQWEPGDDPWTEHARWFPFCKYIVKIKGLAFIEEVARHYNEMYSSNNLDDQLQSTDYTTDFTGNSMYSTDSLLRNSQSADPVGFVLAQGYSLDNAMMAIQQFTQFYNGSNSRRFTGTDLLNIIREREQLGDVIPETINNPTIPGQTINNQPSKALAVLTSEQRKDEEQLDDRALAERNRQLKNQLMCITCQSRDSTIVVTPCGHRVLCDSCSENSVNCPRCNVKIEHKIKSFLA